jgi:hypothetical protein
MPYLSVPMTDHGVDSIPPFSYTGYPSLAPVEFRWRWVL